MFRTSDFDRAELIEQVDKLLADPDDAQEVSA